MVHEHAKQIVAGADETGKVNAQILAVLIGGALLLTAVIAMKLFEQNAYSQTIAVVAALMLGIPLVWQAIKDLATGHMHMNELAALAVVASFANQQYIEAGAIAFFMIISALIEHRTALGARKSIEALIRITPTRARRLTDEGHEVDTDAKDLRPGDRVRVLPGDNIPGDGRVLTGVSTVDQANITGESLPVDKVIGDEVYGGTINVTGAMDIEITKAGHDTTLGRVKDLILQAEHTRSPISRIIDRYAHWYTPVILMFAAIVFFFTKDPNRAIAILIIACPCAFILAVPTAMVAALSAAARLGVLIKNVGTIEVARNLTAIVFDKTGTLTTGQLSVTRLNPLPGVDGAELLKAAATAERNSRHPVARAIVEVARKARLELGETRGFEEVPGRGVRAEIGGEEILVGRATWIAERGVDMSQPDDAGTEGLSLLYVTRGGKLLGWVGLEDKTRPDAARAMDELRAMDMRKLVMVTGDRWSVAKRVAAEMHCTDVQAEVLPAQKLELVDELRAAGHTVAVIGDGVNDAPALAAGDISIAMGAAGSDVAINSASIALMNNNLNRIPFLVHLSRRTITVVRQNLAFSVAYIVGFMAVFATGVLHESAPVVAVLLHLASSLVVIFNSARLVREGEELERNDPPPEVLARQRTISPAQVRPAAAMG
ncbi:MAG: heavy metal translocating P-type ATPase [Phycisphaerales bacterium]